MKFIFLIKKRQNARSQSGQTLIETLVAIAILVTGLISGLALAIYSFRSVDDSSRATVATALARQAIEGVKNIRDTNWLTTPLTDCSAFLGTGQKCYLQWLKGITIGNYAFDFDPTTNSWKFTNTSNYQLKYNSANGLYSDTFTLGPTVTKSNFYRVVNIRAYNNSANYMVQPFINPNPYTSGPGQLIVVTATVWWNSRSCKPNVPLPSIPPSCKVVLEMHLTNWRNY